MKPGAALVEGVVAGEAEGQEWHDHNTEQFDNTWAFDWRMHCMVELRLVDIWVRALRNKSLGGNDQVLRHE